MAAETADIETDRLILRRFELSDLDDFAAIMADPEVMRFSKSGPWTRDITQRFLEGCQIDYSEKRWGYGRLAAVHKADQRLIGFAGLARFDDVDGSPEVELGYRLLPAYWGQGLGTEAAAASRDHAFHDLGMTRLIAMIEPENVASIRVAEKIGMSCEKEIHMWGLRIFVFAISREPTSV
jgi:RimJ/RimL family protein N-acetyltransferase